MNRWMVDLALVTVIGSVFFPLKINAQLLPLELDQTIALPQNSAIWDVMPHPDGYYLWVQATEPDTEQTRIYWGRTDLGNTDSVDLDVGSPRSITCFWRENHEPYVVLSSSFWVYNQYGSFDFASFRIYRLEDGIPDSAAWEMQGIYGGYPGATYIYRNYRSLITALNPAPPEVSSQILMPISHSYHCWGGGSGQYYDIHGDCGVCVLNMLEHYHNPQSLPNYCSTASWCIAGDTLVFVCSGGERGMSSYNGNEGYWSRTDIYAVRSIVDNLIVSCAIWGCSDDSYPFQCPFGFYTATTYDTLNHLIYYFFVNNGTYGTHSSPSSDTDWTVPGPYTFWISAECIPGNNAEEFLCYDPTRPVFDIFGAADGHYYGVTDNIEISESGTRIIGRYDSTSRRLVVKTGNHLNLYRFGEYLPVDDPNHIPHPSSFILSAFPNPFNPSTTISFTLPRSSEVKLVVYDVNGRLVQTLREGKLEAGEHSVEFDGHDLPSGIYFAQLQASSFSKTEKMVLLK